MLVLVVLWLMLGAHLNELARVLHKALLVSVLMYGSETMTWKLSRNYLQSRLL